MIKRIGLAVAIVAALGLGTVAASAQSGPEPPNDAPVPATTEATDSGYFDDELDMDYVVDLIGDEISPELIAELNAETDALVEYLRAQGFTVDVDDVTIRLPMFDEDNEAIWQAIDDYYTAQFAGEVAEWTDEEKAEWNAEIDAFVAELAAEGITVETTEIAPGVRDIVWTDELEDALWDLEDDFEDDYYEDYEDDDLFDDDEDDELFEDDEELVDSNA